MSARSALGDRACSSQLIAAKRATRLARTIIAAGALLYTGSLHGAFVFDDLHTIVHNPDIDASLTSVWGLFGLPRSRLRRH